MTETLNPADIGALIRRQGTPDDSVVQLVEPQVRTDQFVGTLATRTGMPPFAIAPLIIEWRYNLAYRKLNVFRDFLMKNEVFIADSCAKAMTGVEYHGTYYGLTGQRAAYRTYWGYESWESLKEWDKALADPKSNLYIAMHTFRKFWLSDPHSSQEHFGFAATVDHSASAMSSLTIDADT